MIALAYGDGQQGPLSRATINPHLSAGRLAPARRSLVVDGRAQLCGSNSTFEQHGQHVGARMSPGRAPRDSG